MTILKILTRKFRPFSPNQPSLKRGQGRFTVGFWRHKGSSSPFEHHYATLPSSSLKKQGLHFTVLESTQRSSSHIWRRNKDSSSPFECLYATLRHWRNKATRHRYRNSKRSSLQFEDNPSLCLKSYTSLLFVLGCICNASCDTPWHLPSFLLLLCSFFLI